MGSSWGINRTMAQIHALLLTARESLSTDDVMEQLAISRGNTNTNLRELVSWGLVRSVVRRGDRKEYFEAEKDVWRIFCIIARERKRREITPAMDVLKRCAAETADLDTPEARTFHDQMRNLLEFMEMGETVLDRIARSEQSTMLKFATRFLTK